MSYFHVAEQNPSLAGLACGPNCRCAACRSPRVGLRDRYIQGLGSPLAQAETSPRGHSTLPVPLPKNIWLYNTDLNAPYFGGNFDFLYNGGANESIVTFNAYLSYRKHYSDPDKAAFVHRLRSAVAVWDNAAEVQVKDTSGNYNTKI